MPRLQINQKLVVAVVYVSAMLMSSLDSTIVNVALATLGREFNVTPASIEAVVIGYLVSLAAFIPASGWLGDRFGTKRIFLIALAIFTGASALCGLAQSLNQLVAFRVLQGAGGGLLTPVGMAMLYRAFPPEERVRVSRILMFALIIGPASGPVVGGLLIERLSWRWAFYVNIPVGFAALAFGFLFLREHREPAVGRFDLPGFLLAGSGLGLLMYALSEGPSRGWTSPAILACALAGLLLLAAFVVVELRVAAPMVQLRLLGNTLFRSTLLVSLFATAGFVGVLFLVPLFLQEARGASPLSSGLTTFPEALGVVLSTQVVARLYPRIGPRRLMVGGMSGIATVMALLGLIDLNTSPWLVRLLMFLLGVGMAYIFLPNQAASLATISREDTGRATMFSSVQRQLGAALGVAALSSVLALVGPVQRDAAGAEVPHLAAYRAAFLAAASFAAIGALLALRVPDRDAVATMQPRPVRSRPREAPALEAD
ncbi:MAG: multidrug efflux MFS transporter [Chloroflexota bacterium]|nr:multidrug efflux MFS transporter [Chloroflexota bacterium]